MFSKTLFVLFFAALAHLQVVAASPPGCLLGAIKNYSDPSDISSVCKDKDASGKIAKVCGDDTKDALSAFADVCNNAGVKVSTQISSSATASSSGTAAVSSATGSASPSGSGSGSGSGSSNGTVATTLATASGASGPKPTASASGASAPQSTGAAGKLELSAAAILAGFGLVAVAL